MPYTDLHRVGETRVHVWLAGLQKHSSAVLSAYAFRHAANATCGHTVNRRVNGNKRDEARQVLLSGNGERLSPPQVWTAWNP